MLAWVAPAGAPLAGCGEATPPPMSKEGLETVKKDRETIIMKEYGQQAYDKAVGKKAAKGAQPSR
jgi:hypothetical protein